MAQIFHAGEVATEGERRAADVLRLLPDDWTVICNKTLVTRSGRSFEIDFLVLGEHYVFAIDEKSWQGRIHGSDQVWVRDDGSSERSPLGKIEYVANVLANELRASHPFGMSPSTSCAAPYCYQGPKSRQGSETRELTMRCF